MDHEDRIRELEKWVNATAGNLINSNSIDEVRNITRKYFNIIKNRVRFRGYSDVQESEEVITEIADAIFLKNTEGNVEKTLE